MSVKISSKTHTLDNWVKIILTKFNDIAFQKRGENVAKILGITSKSEMKKINVASLIAYGRRLGVESFEMACDKLGISNSLPNFTGLDSNLSNRFLSEYKLIIIIKALNEGWYPNWENENEYKWMNYFQMKDGFSYWDTHFYITTTIVPSALCLKNKELAEYCALRFYKLYEEYYK